MNGARSAKAYVAISARRMAPRATPPRPPLARAVGVRSALDLVDLPPPVIHQFVVPLHDGLELLHVLLALPLALEHLLERLQARNLHLGHQGPVPLGAEIGEH